MGNGSSAITCFYSENIAHVYQEFVGMTLIIFKLLDFSIICYNLGCLCPTIFKRKANSFAHQ